VKIRMNTGREKIIAKPSWQTALAPIGVLQRKCACGNHALGGQCEICGKESEAPMQRKAVGSAEAHEAPPIVHEALSSPGQPLDAETRAFFEPRFGHDFSDVRAHTDAIAARSARAVDARAYTFASHIAFADGAYNPQTDEGRHLLAHELAHTLQQEGNSNSIKRSSNQALEINKANAPAEREADRITAEVMEGRRVSSPSGIHAPTLSRQPAGGAGAESQRPASQRNAAASAQPERFAPNVDLGRMSRYYNGRADALLNRGPAMAHALSGRGGDAPPCQIDLFLKLHFDFHLGPSEYREGTWGGMTQPGPPWPADRAQRWKLDYMRMAQNTWRTRSALERAGECPTEPCNRAVGQLRIVDADQMTDSDGRPVQVPGMTNTPHFNVRVFEFRPLAGRQESRVGGSESTMYAEDILPRGTPPPAGFDQDKYRWMPGAAPHETGHMLGRPHVNCAPDVDNPNDERCYGESPTQLANVMGRGSEVSQEDHAPFLAALRATTDCSWRVVPGGPPWWAILLIGIATAGIGLLILGLAGLL
jgi:hypothetical protein